MSTTYLSRPDAASYLSERGLQVSKLTLAKWATTGGGPLYRRFGNRSVYVAADLDVWAAEKLSPPKTSTSCVGSQASNSTLNYDPGTLSAGAQVKEVS
jgi:hypothetical protein